MKIHRYKGYKIAPYPYQSTADDWISSVVIMKPSLKGEVAMVKFFTAEATFVREEEAKQHALEVGHLIVDGKHPTFTLAELDA